MENFSMEKAKELLDGGLVKAQEYLKDTSKIDGLLVQLEDKLEAIPNVGETLAGVPTMVQMIKSYITKEYDVVSPKVIGLMVSAVLYLVKGKDVIPDNIPFVGHLDDIAIMGLALKLCEGELKAYKEWRDNKDNVVLGE